MSSSSALKKAKQFSLSREQVIILWKITQWFNRRVFEISGNRISIASSHEPSLPEFFGDDWGPDYVEAHEQLVDRGLVKSAERDGEEALYVASRRCDWLPTQKAMRAIEHIFSHRDDVCPDWAPDDPDRPPTCRDGNELLEHRKGVMVAEHKFRQLPEHVTYAGIYPRLSTPHRPDLRFYRYGDVLAYVEVQTGHNDLDRVARKFDAWRDVPVIWVFDSRPTMIDAWNHLVRNDLIELDGGRFTSPGATKDTKNNWPPRRVNDRLRRSREGDYVYGSIDGCWTIAGILQADSVQLFNFLDRNILSQRS